MVRLAFGMESLHFQGGTLACGNRCHVMERRLDIRFVKTQKEDNVNAKPNILSTAGS